MHIPYLTDRPRDFREKLEYEIVLNTFMANLSIFRRPSARAPLQKLAELARVDNSGDKFILKTLVVQKGEIRA